MQTRTVNGVPINAIVDFSNNNTPKNLEWQINEEDVKWPDFDMAEPDAQWPEYFQRFKSRILDALNPHRSDHNAKDENSHTNDISILSITHVRSTSVPNLPAKPCIDIDLVLTDDSLSAETFYVPRLQAAGFNFLIRNPPWYEHRFFSAYEPIYCHLHVWAQGSPEVERHRIFKERLMANDDDRELYARTKRESAATSKEMGESMGQYNHRKRAVLREICGRAFKALGYLDEEE